MSKYEYNIQLLEMGTGKAMNVDGTYKVVSAGGTAELTLYDTSDAALANPASISDGMIEFRTATTVASVDIYGYTEEGYAFQIKGITPGSIKEFYIDKGRLHQTIVIPVDVTDSDISASAENLLGFYLANDVLVLAEGLGFFTATADAGTTCDIGTDSSAGVNDPDGFADGLDVASTGMNFVQVGYSIGSNSIYVDLTGGTQEFTIGELLTPSSTQAAAAEGTDVDTEANGFYSIVPHEATNTSSTDREQLSITFAGSPTTIAGFVIIPTRLPYPV